MWEGWSSTVGAGEIGGCPFWARLPSALRGLVVMRSVLVDGDGDGDGDDDASEGQPSALWGMLWRVL